jgi:steroid delta-isomerase
MLRLVARAALILALAQMPARADDAADIRATLEQWKTDFNARNADSVCGLFAAEAIAQFRGQPERNYDEVCDLLQESLADPAKRFTYALDIREILVAADLAVVRLVWTLTIGAPVNESSVEPGMDIFRRQPDGSWKIIRYLAYDAP